LCNSKEFNKPKDTPAKYVLCGGSHPANYKSFEHYHNLIKGNNTYRTPPIRAPPLVPNLNGHTTPFQNTPQQKRNYAEVTKNHEHQVEDTAIMLNKFLEEFKGLFTQLLQQNNMILNMLTTLINKPH
jgi:hypothetical protein